MTRRGDDRGSLPIALLVVLLVGALVTVLLTTIVTGQGQTRFDQGYEQALQVGESGLDRMAHLVRTEQRTSDFTVTGAGQGGTYEGTAVRDARGDWTLTATGTAPEGTTRTVRTTLRWESVFGVAAFGRTQVGMRGGNTADSFQSGVLDPVNDTFSPTAGGSNICLSDGSTANPTRAADSGDTRMCNPTGNGVVATNEELFLRGGVIDRVDRAEIHYAREGVSDPLPGATGFCGGVAETCASAKLAYFREPLEVEPNPVVPPGDLINQGAFNGGVLPAGRQLYTNVTLDSNTVVLGTPTNPTIIYLTGTLRVPNGAVVNFQKDAAGNPTVPEPPPSLLIFSAGVGPALRFGNHASLSGAVFAPRAAFSGGAAGNIYGAMVANSVSTQGSWNFHYDDALGEVETEARRELEDWREQ